VSPITNYYLSCTLRFANAAIPYILPLSLLFSWLSKLGIISLITSSTACPIIRIMASYIVLKIFFIYDIVLRITTKRSLIY